jgi:lysophospholipase L1-like esterase
VVGRGALILAVLLMLLGGLELLARLLYQPPQPRRVYDPYCYQIPRPLLIERFKVSNDTDQWITIRMNERGMRGPRVSSEAEGALTLAFLGGSVTENYRYNDQDTFPVLVGQEIEGEFGLPVRVFNAGMSGGTTFHSLARLQHQVLDLKPDLVVVQHAVNDLVGGFHPRWRPDGRHLWRPKASNRPISYLLSRIRQGRPNDDFTTDVPYAPLDRPRPPTEKCSVEDFSGFPALATFERNLRSMAGVARIHRVPILFLTQGSMYGAEVDPTDKDERLIMTRVLIKHGVLPPDFPSLARGMITFNQRTLALPETGYSYTLDLASQLPMKWEVFYDDVHLTQQGNILVARAIAPVAAAILRDTVSGGEDATE